MKYPARASSAVPSVTGAQVSGAKVGFLPSRPSTWPVTPDVVNVDFISTLKAIIEESILGEIKNVIGDAQAHNGGLEYRGHVVAIALMCALDAISGFAYRGGAKGWNRGKHIKLFVRVHFPKQYQKHAKAICELYRNCLIHSWNLFEVSVSPGSEPTTLFKGTLSFGLLNFLAALETGTANFLVKLSDDAILQQKALDRYRVLRQTAKP